MLKETSTLAQLSSKYSVTGKSIQLWKKQFLANASLVLDPEKVVSVYKEQINKLKSSNDELAKALGKTTVERDWAVGKFKSLDLSNKKRLVESKLINLSKARQCGLLSINRSSMYYRSKVLSSSNTTILDKIDSIYYDNPDYGYRYIYRQLKEDGLHVGRDRVLKYMGIMGIKAIYPCKKKTTSIKDSSHKIHSCLFDKYWLKSGEKYCSCRSCQ